MATAGAGTGLGRERYVGALHRMLVGGPRPAIAHRRQLWAHAGPVLRPASVRGPRGAPGDSGRSRESVRPIRARGRRPRTPRALPRPARVGTPRVRSHALI